MARQVFIWGAGASTHSKAPLARKLMSKIMEYVETPPAPEIVKYQHEQIEWLTNWLKRFEFNEWRDNFDIEMFCTMLDFLNFGFHIQGTQKDLSGKFAHILNENAFQVGEVIKIIQILITHILSPLKIKDEKGILKQFIARHVKKDDVLITFNYDLLLDQALWELSIWTPYEGYIIIDNLNIPDGFQKQDNLIIYLKLHGSINWSNDILSGSSWKYFDRGTGTSYMQSIK